MNIGFISQNPHQHLLPLAFIVIAFFRKGITRRRKGKKSGCSNMKRGARARKHVHKNGIKPTLLNLFPFKNE